MVSVTVGNNVNRVTTIINENTTLRTCLEENGVDYTRGALHLDGSTLQPGALDKTFKDLGYDGTDGHNRCFLMSVAKADNA